MSADLNLMPADFDTLVYVPSISLGPLTRRHLIGLDYFQERNYYILAALKDPTKQVIFVLSDAMQEDLFNAHIDLLERVLELPSDARCRCHAIKVKQPQEVSLSAAFLADTQSRKKLKSLIDKRRAIFDFWTVGKEEISLAAAFGLPHLGMPASLVGADGKAAAKRLFDRANVESPPDFGMYFTLVSLWDSVRAGVFSGAETVLLKLNHEEGGNGIARFRSDADLKTVDALRRSIAIDKPYIDLPEFEVEMALQGALVETFVTDEIIASPSAKMEIDELGVVSILATHDQVLRNSMYLGCRFPADNAYRAQVSQAALRIGQECARDGWRGIVSVDFLLTRSSGKGAEIKTTLWAIEINARKCATTHPYFWTRAITGADFNPDAGVLRVGGQEMVYQSSEYVASPMFENLSGACILQMIKDAGLEYDPILEGGVLVHMLSCAQGYQKIGVTVFGMNYAQTSKYLKLVDRLISD
jgi:L-propargylglycine--L-glutamate ligase